MNRLLVLRRGDRYTEMRSQPARSDGAELLSMGVHELVDLVLQSLSFGATTRGVDDRPESIQKTLETGDCEDGVEMSKERCPLHINASAARVEDRWLAHEVFFDPRAN